MPLAGFCNGSDPRAHLRVVQSPAAHCDGKPSRDGVAGPLARLPAELSRARGYQTNPVNPHRDDRSPRWIYPDLFDPDTSCRELVPHKTWKPALWGDRAVRWFRTSSPEELRRSAPPLAGLPSTPTRESERFWQEPEVPSTTKLAEELDKESSAEPIARLRSTTRRLSNQRAVRS